MNREIETVMDHQRRTGHGGYCLSAERDRQFAETLYGRPPRETDPFVGLLVCATCDADVLNARESGRTR